MEKEKNRNIKIKNGWEPSPWNKEVIPIRDNKTEPIMMCKRCKHPR
jgi:hypothetical protein